MVNGNELEVHKSGWNIEDFKIYRIKDYRIVKDDMFSDFIKKIPNLPIDSVPELKLLVFWLQKSD